MPSQREALQQSCLPYRLRDEEGGSQETSKEDPELWQA